VITSLCAGSTSFSSIENEIFSLAEKHIEWRARLDINIYYEFDPSEPPRIINNTVVYVRFSDKESWAMKCAKKDNL
jgi:hypothetical protein